MAESLRRWRKKNLKQCPGLVDHYKTGLEVEIKATQSNSVAFRSQPQHTIIIKILRDGTFEEIYNGPGCLVWEQFKGKRLPSNGQFQVSLNKLRQLNQQVAESDRVPRAI